jgi:DNA-directed RNA polymerase sigma subunit (sigma70/sigma32)
MRKLKGRKREVLLMRYMDGLTLEQVGERLGITRERVRQIEKQALDSLRADYEFMERARDILSELDAIHKESIWS